MARTGIGAFVAILALWLAFPAAQQATFRAGTELVSVTATVTDRQGQFLSDLAQESFEVLEDGKPQTINISRAGMTSNQVPSCTSACCSTPAAAWTQISRCPGPRRSSSSTR